jgi:hypothetical protein
MKQINSQEQRVEWKLPGLCGDEDCGVLVKGHKLQLGRIRSRYLLYSMVTIINNKILYT